MDHNIIKMIVDPNCKFQLGGIYLLEMIVWWTRPAWPPDLAAMWQRFLSRHVSRRWSCMFGKLLGIRATPWLIVSICSMWSEVCRHDSALAETGGCNHWPSQSRTMSQDSQKNPLAVAKWLITEVYLPSVPNQKKPIYPPQLFLHVYV